MPHTVPELASDIRIACLRVARRVRYQTSTLAPHVFSVLAYLDHHGTSTAAELATRERVSAPSMSRTVGELAERNLITRTPDETDKRRVHLDITDQGRRALCAARGERNAWMSERLQGCTDEERETLAQAATILNRLAQED